MTLVQVKKQVAVKAKKTLALVEQKLALQDFAPVYSPTGFLNVQAKVDVSAAEVIESLNVQALKDAAIANKMLTDAYGARLASNSKLYDVTASALGLATLGATHNMTLQQQMASDHRDQNHDRQINVNETDAYSVLGIATLVERLRNPTPVEE